MRVAAFSDTHGNALALDAVLADIEARGPFDHLLMAGDLVAGGPRPVETLARIRSLQCPVVLGNTDYYLFASPEELDKAGVSERERAMNAWTAERIEAEGLAFLQGLPRRHAIPGSVLMVHANPDDLEAAIEPHEPEEGLRRRLAAVSEPVLVFGHLHMAYQRRLDDRLLVDVASAGFPRDGDHRAAWAEIWYDGSAWQARHHRVPYDIEAVLEQLASSEMPNAAKRAKVLRKARYKDDK